MVGSILDIRAKSGRRATTAVARTSVVDGSVSSRVICLLEDQMLRDKTSGALWCVKRSCRSPSNFLSKSISKQFPIDWDTSQTPKSKQISPNGTQRPGHAPTRVCRHVICLCFICRQLLCGANNVHIDSAKGSIVEFRHRDSYMEV